MHIEVITVGSQSLRYAESGPSDATEALLLFNGIGANVETFATLMDSFVGKRVVTFDVPGVGGSPPPSMPYRFMQIASLAARFLDRLGIDTVDVFGVSWGGALAQQFAYNYPERTRSMVLAATSAGVVMVPGSLNILGKMLTPRRYSDPEYMAQIGPEIYGGLLRENQELLAEHMEAMTHSSIQGYFFQLAAISGWTSWPWLPRLKLPVLVLMGTDDPIVPLVNGKILCRRLPNAELVEIDCGHLFVVTLPEETARHMQVFFDRLCHSTGTQG